MGSLLNAIDIRAELGSLRPPLRQAIELHYLEDLQIESINDQEKTVSKIMGVTPRMVRNYLREAELQLRRNQKLREIWNDVQG
jgi:DNA-directed RNA polymerase specialized sigma24 family protein